MVLLRRDASYVMAYVNVFDYETATQELLDPGTWAYMSGGADDEVTLHANRRAFERVQFRQRVLVNVSTIDMQTGALGLPLALPLLIAPMGFQGLMHPEGECAVARALGSTGPIMVVSSFSSRSLEEIAQSATGPLWFQLSAPDRPWVEQLLQRATAAGYRALVITVDAPRSGRKERADRQGFQLPPFKANFGSVPLGNNFSSLSTWDALDWLRSLTSLPLVLKGVQTGEDAQLALEHGIHGIIVSNHGGRQLDGVPATLDVLPEIVEAGQGRCEVYLDSGIRRGADVFKALALGAQAVLLGRPVLWGLTVNGTRGVEQVLDMIRLELEQTMALVGCPTLKTLNRSFLRKSVQTNEGNE